MTLIATNNGVPIIKDGKLATSCGCCGGACCNGIACTVKPQEECNAAAGEVFKGVGTVCSPNPCLCCGTVDTPAYLILTISNFNFFAFDPIDSTEVNGAYTLTRLGHSVQPQCTSWESYGRPAGFVSFECRYPTFPQSQAFNVGIRVLPTSTSWYFRRQDGTRCFSYQFPLKGTDFCGRENPFSGNAIGVDAGNNQVAQFSWTITPAYSNPLP